MATNDDGITITATKSNTGVSDFVRTTREEIRKVTWPERKETLITTVLIVVLALVAGVFFLMVDSALGFAVSHFLGMSSQ